MSKKDDKNIEEPKVDASAEGATDERDNDEEDVIEESALDEVTADEGEPVGIEELKARATERDEFLGMLQRARAEFSNYRKRVERERGEMRTRVIGEFVMKLLPVLDDFDRALVHADESADLESFVKGIRLIENKIYEVLKRSGVESFEPERGDGFNPVEHDALIVEQTDEYPDDSVSGVHLKGYRMGDRILRPAQVKVAKQIVVKDETPTEDTEGKEEG